MNKYSIIIIKAKTIAQAESQVCANVCICLHHNQFDMFIERRLADINEVTCLDSNDERCVNNIFSIVT